jgi:hypothetical protein
MAVVRTSPLDSAAAPGPPSGPAGEVMSVISDTNAMLDDLLSQDDAACALARFGVDVSPVEGFEPDYRRLLLGLDVLFANGYGTSALAGFLEAPDHRLSWRCPADVVREPGGVEQVRGLIEQIVVARRSRTVRNA